MFDINEYCFTLIHQNSNMPLKCNCILSFKPLSNLILSFFFVFCFPVAQVDTNINWTTIEHN